MKKVEERIEIKGIERKKWRLASWLATGSGIRAERYEDLAPLHVDMQNVCIKA